MKRIRDAIFHLVLARRSISTQEIADRLAEAGFEEVPTTLLIQSTRNALLRTLKFLEEAGVLEPDVRVALPAELKPKRHLKRSLYFKRSGQWLSED